MRLLSMIKFFFKTYGCQANVADSEGLAKFLSALECEEALAEQDADLIIVNTCAVREKAEQKLFSYIGLLSDIKREKPYIKIGIIGCVASYKKDELYKRFDQITFVYGARDDMKTLEAYLADLVVSLQTTKQLQGDAPQTQDTFVIKEQDRDVKKIVTAKGLFKNATLASSMFKRRAEIAKPFAKQLKEVARSYINIMTGCNKFCAYCIVPFTRGREVSYDLEAIVQRVEHDLLNGSKEITLIGQNVNSYRDPATGKDFSELLRRVAALDYEFWVRWVSPHPQDMTEELFDVIAQHQDKIPPYVHFPVQSGSNTILESMKRNYSVEQYLEQIGWLRARMPEACISTDIIVGFPGETEEDFQATMKILEQVQYDWVYSFIYSPRKHTFAARMSDDCLPEVKSKRLECLQKRQIEIGLERYKTYVGKTVKVLVEKCLTDGELLARTGGNHRVIFKADSSLIGSFVSVLIKQTGPVNMHAELIK